MKNNIGKYFFYSVIVACATFLMYNGMQEELFGGLCILAAAYMLRNSR